MPCLYFRLSRAAEALSFRCVFARDADTTLDDAYVYTTTSRRLPPFAAAAMLLSFDYFFASPIDFSIDAASDFAAFHFSAFFFIIDFDAAAAMQCGTASLSPFR